MIKYLQLIFIIKTAAIKQKNKMNSLIKTLFLTAFLLVLQACQIQVNVPEGGSVATESGEFACSEGDSCSLVVDDIFFTDTFTAHPNFGYKFTEWKTVDRGFCGGNTGPCTLTTTAFEAFPILMAFLLNNEEIFFLEPIFEIDEFSDLDNDGVIDSLDAFPSDPLEVSDCDLDGIGDNSDLYPADPLNIELSEVEETAEPNRPGDDYQIVWPSSVEIDGSSASELIIGYQSRNTIYAGGGSDSINAGDGGDFIFTFGTTDFIENDSIDGGSGTDIVALHGLGGINSLNYINGSACLTGTSYDGSDYRLALENVEYVLELGTRLSGVDDPAWIGPLIQLSLPPLPEPEHETASFEMSGRNARSVDINNDGLNDLIVTTQDVGEHIRDGEPYFYAPGPVRIYITDASGILTDKTEEIIKGEVSRIDISNNTIVSDFNQDGYVDIFFSDSGYDAESGIQFSPSQSVGRRNTLLLSDGNGHLVDVSSTNIPQFSDFTHGASAGDIDNDGDEDIWVNNVGSQYTEFTSYLLLNDGEGSFTPVADLTDIGINGSAMLAPLAAYHPYPSERMPPELFTEGKGDSTNGWWSVMLEANQIPGEEIVILSAKALNESQGSRPDFVLMNDGTGHFTEANHLAIPVPVWGAPDASEGSIVVDVNNDGLEDIFISRTYEVGSAVFQLVINNGDGTFSDETMLRLPDQDSPLDPESRNYGDSYAVDIDNDGHIDVATVVNSDPYWLRNDGNGVFREMGKLPFSSSVYAPIDLRADGTIEYVIPVKAGSESRQSLGIVINTEYLADSDPAATLDSDNDGVIDIDDAFPNDPNEFKDSDEDGIGDNTDAFPDDPLEWSDSDDDGIGDNSDAFPNDANEVLDTDGDGSGDNSDVFPLDPDESRDTDGDGIGDNSDFFPLDPGASQESDITEGGATPFRNTNLYFAPNRFLATESLNGMRFENGFTFSFWVYAITEFSPNTTIIGASFSSLRISTDGNGRIQVTALDQSTSLPHLDGMTWHHIAITYDLDTLSVRLNHELVSSFQMPDRDLIFPNEEGDALYFGGANNGFRGFVKEVKLFDSHLTDESISIVASNEDSSNIASLRHQWLFNEGRGNLVKDSAGDASLDVTRPGSVWLESDGGFKVQYEKTLVVTNEEKLLPIPIVIGVADMNQDGFDDLFYHGAFDFNPVENTPLLALENVGGDYFKDSSDSLIDGGLYYKVYPSGRETIVADFNNDGFDDIFMGQSGEHMDVEGSEVNGLLLSQGSSGKMFPKDETNLLSFPCVRTTPAYEGQRPCEAREGGELYYTDESADKVSVNINSNNHGTVAGDIDNDGDVDIFVGAFRPGLGSDPVQPYFLINDGNGVFTADWQKVPGKAFRVREKLLNLNGIQESHDSPYVHFELNDFDEDGFLDLALIGGSLVGLHEPESPFDVEDEFWDLSEHDLIAWGDVEGFSEEYTVLEQYADFTVVNSSVASADFDGDGDIDMVIAKSSGNVGGQLLQFHKNLGDRVFKDTTQENIPQNPISVKNADVGAGDLKELDINSDGCIDLIHVTPASGLSSITPPHTIWLNNCRGYFTPVEDRLLGFLGSVLSVDYDNDGDNDFVSIVDSKFGNEIYYDFFIIERDGEVNFDEYIDTDRDGHLDIYDADDDGDGILDVEDEFPKSALN